MSSKYSGLLTGGKIGLGILAIVGVFQFFFLGAKPEVDPRVMTLTRGLNGDPESLDPHKFTSVQAGNVIRDLGEGLLSYSSKGELIGGVASSWKISSDGLKYTFRLRSSARWSNGQPVTADDFVYSFHRLFDLKEASSSLSNLAAIENAREIMAGEKPLRDLGVSAIDDHMLVIHLDSPTPYFLQLLTHPSTFPVYKGGVDKFGDLFVRAGNLVTNGPYELAERIPSSAITLARNEYYWDNSNTWFNLVVYYVADPSSEVRRYRAGEIDVTASVDSGVFELMRNNRPNELKVAPYLSTYYYGFNLSREPFKSRPKLRQALSMAIDRETIVSAVTRRGELPAYGIVPPGVANYGSQNLTYEKLSNSKRHEEARRLYAEAGYSPESPLQFELRYNTIGGHEKIAVAVQSMWKNVLGAEARLVNEEFKVFISNVISMEATEAYRLSWTGDYDDAQSFLQLFQTNNPNNLTAYSNASIDSLMAKAAAEVDPSTRRQFLEEVERLSLSEHPLIPVYFFVNKHLVQPYIQGWEPSLLDIHLSKHLSRKPEKLAANEID